MNVKTYKETFISKKGESLNLQNEEESKIHMAEDGYGKATSEGIDENGYEITASTDNKDSVMKKKINKSEDTMEQFFSLKGIFETIRKRFAE